MKPVRHFVEFLFLFGLVTFFAVLPRPVAARFGRCLGFLIYHLGIRRRVVLENLAVAFPEMEPAAREELARRCYRHYGAVIADQTSLHFWSREKVIARTRLERSEILENALAKGKGCVIATGHLGAFDIGPPRLQLAGWQITSVYQGVRNPYVDRFISRIRSLYGARVATRGMGMREAIAALRRGEAVCILADQDAGKRGLFLPFFSRPASTLVGPAELALRTGAVLMPGFVIREGSLYRMIAEEPIPPSDVKTMMAEYNRRLESAIRRWPEQYFWLHKRWKSRPPEEIGTP